MSAPGYPYQPSGMPWPDKTPEDIAAWHAAEPGFARDPMSYVGRALSASIEYDLSGQSALAGFWKEVEIRLRLAANNPHVGLATPEQLAHYGIEP
jgi:hypothetical protein